MAPEIRLVQNSEQSLIFSFLFLAARMLEEKEPIQKALVDSLLKKYWVDWGRPGDLGMVHIDPVTAMPVSCAWVRLFSKEEAGSGYVGDGIPELATGTIEGFRNRGIGASTLKALIVEAKSKYPGICLSVREDNPAVKLYERLDFKKLLGSEMRNRVGTRSFNMLLRF